MICRATNAAERVTTWEQVNGKVIDGQRVGWTCLVPYCSRLEHMELVVNKNYGNVRWRELAEKIDEIPIDEYIDFRLPPMPLVQNRIVASISCHTPARIAVRQLSNGCTRIHRIGRWGTLGEPDVLTDRPLPPFSGGRVKPWLRRTSVWLGQWFNPHQPIPRNPPCKIRGCPFIALHGKGDYCFQHTHFFDYNVSMTWNGLDRESIYSPRDKCKPWELAAEFLRSTDSLEKSLRFTMAAPKHRMKAYDERHKNAGNLDPKPFVQRSAIRLHRRLGSGSHSGAKTTDGRKRAAARQGPAGIHSTKEKRWTRDTIESLERQADEILKVGYGKKAAQIERLLA